MELASSDAVSASARAELETEVLEFFVRAAQLLGQPRSIGEIYGLLYLSVEPLSMEAIVSRLKISTGSASQGLKQLRAFRAVRTTYVPGERRDHYVAEQELRKVLSGFVQEEIKPHLDSGRDRLDRMAVALNALEIDEKELLEKRIQRLEKLHGLTGKLLPVMLRFLKI